MHANIHASTHSFTHTCTIHSRTEYFLTSAGAILNDKDLRHGTSGCSGAVKGGTFKLKVKIHYRFIEERI